MDIMLNLGCGPKPIPNWLNTDGDLSYIKNANIRNSVTELDVTKTFPQQSGSVAFIYSEHMIEHLTTIEARNMLEECHRVLHKDGVLRLSTPNLSNLVKLHEHSIIGDEFISLVSKKCGIKNDWSTVLNAMFYNWGHKYLYTTSELMALCQSVGFSVTPVLYHQSAYKELQNLEARGDAAISAFESIILECTKL